MLKKYFNVIIFYAIYFFVIFILITIPQTNNIIIKGIATVTQNDLNTKTIKLDGEWKFFYKKFFSVDNIQTTNEKPLLVTLPGFWQNYKIDSIPISGVGYGTFYSRINIPHYKGIISVRMPVLCSAYSLYINNQKVIDNGSFDSNGNVIETKLLEKTGSVFINSDKIDIIIHCANRAPTYSGTEKSIELGLPKIIAIEDYKLIAYDFFILGGLIIIGLFHLFMYLTRKNDKNLIFFSLMCFSSAIYGVLFYSGLSKIFFDNLNWIIQMKSYIISLNLTIIFFILYFTSLFSAYTKPKILKFLISLFIISSIFELIIPITHLWTATTFNYIGYVLLYVYFCSVISKVLISVKTEKYFTILYSVIALLALTLDLLFNLHFIKQERSTFFAMFLFVFLQSLLLSKKFTDSFNKIELLYQINSSMIDEIKELNNTLEIKVQDRTEELEAAFEEIQDTNEKLFNEMAETKKANEEISIAYEKINLLYKSDYLTGLYNRIGIKEVIHNKISSAEYFCIAMCDIDNFKSINDTYGHDFGDEVLKSSSKIIINHINESGYAARWGGEEFLLIINKNLDSSYILIEELRKCLSENIISYNNNKTNISMTFGLTEHTGKIPVELSINNSDKALYEGKNSGKNKTIIFR